MKSTMTIDPQLPLHPAQDYARLREEGMEYIRQLCGQLWTDHNLHDPGITTLEALCYAITDLGYRTDFPTEDLLTGQEGFIAEPQRSGFFPAQQALTTTPLTPLDYRKLLLKIEGVRNAWMYPRLETPGSELPVFADALSEQLSLSASNLAGEANAPLHINGLYDVWLELEPDSELGSLNETALPLTLRSGAFKAKTGQLLLVTDTPAERAAWASIELPEDLSSLTLVLTETGSRSTLIDLSVDDAPLPQLKLQLDQPLPGAVDETDWLALLTGDTLLRQFQRKQQRIETLLGRARCALHENRNLCEDYASVETISADLVAVCADIEVSPGADLEQVQAEVYFAIERYFNPPVSYYSLSEMLDAGFDAEAIFDGPFIDQQLSFAGEPVFNKPGFLRDDELAGSELRTMLHSSDIINILMDIPDLVNVKSLLLRKYAPDGTPLGDSERWCLPIRTGHQPVLSLGRSKILFFKQGVPFIARQAEFEATLRHLRAAAIKQAYSGVEEALSVPIGRKRDTLSHYPVQYDFPATYQIGQAGLKANADHTRVTQARQFKGYLLFFEQILADYLAQLAHLPQLFSLDSDLNQSYFSQYLNDIQGTAPGTPGSFAAEFYLDPSRFADVTERARLRETPELMQERRNRLLDHLLARFAEQFTDYVMLMVRQQGDSLKTNADLINDKIDFLRQQPVLSRERNRAFNYRPQDLARVWDSTNVSGLEKRAARLAGIDHYQRRDLSCQQLLTTLMDTRQTGDEFRVEIKDADNFLLFKSWELFVDRDAAMAVAYQIYPALNSDDTYVIEADGDEHFVWFLRAAGQSLQQDRQYDSPEEAQADIAIVRARFAEVLAESPSETESEPPIESPLHPANVLFDTREYGRDHRVEIKDPEQYILFKSRELFATVEEAWLVAETVFPGVKEIDSYQIDDSGGAGAVFFRLAVNGRVLVHDELFDNRNDARRRIDQIIARYYEVLKSTVCNDEGMYLIEHLLLRPRRADAELPTVCLDEQGTACSDEDPFSFKASVILPYWPQRFRNLAFRRFFENLLREQAPAHIHLKICWIDHWQMAALEQALHAWLEALASEAFDSPLLTERQNTLIEVLGSLRSVYPTATLHDCDDDDSGAPVRLGSTNLGVT
ncbi:hypothetical protein ACQUQP_11410 [Marinobacterium sp. YM272]|uniref:hypothetical protein n=1 Tax=Marinobacterium sp. YM272 TaxID=3421654 RepID=UPI003D7F70DE